MHRALCKSLAEEYAKGDEEAVSDDVQTTIDTFYTNKLRQNNDEEAILYEFQWSGFCLCMFASCTSVCFD